MSFAALLGLVTGVSVLYYAISTSTDSPQIFGDPHGIAIVIGGTLTVALLCFDFSRLFLALKVIAKKVFGSPMNDYFFIIKTIVETSSLYRQNPKEALQKLPKKTHPFLVDGMKYLVEYGFTEDEIDDVLTNAVEGKQKRDEEEISVWHTISRFPPAFGLLGATMGMIALLQTLGEPGSQDRIGPAMAIALVATFYGIMTANFILIPIAEKLSDISKHDLVMRNMIKEGIMLIQQKKHPLYIEEYLKSFLAPKFRAKEMMKTGKEQPNKKAA